MKFILIAKWENTESGEQSHVKTFNAEDHAEALDKAFGNPKNLSDKACDDPDYWFESHTECEMYRNGSDNLPTVSLFEISSQVKGATKRLKDVDAEVCKRREVLEIEEEEKEQMELYQALKKKFRGV